GRGRPVREKPRHSPRVRREALHNRGTVPCSRSCIIRPVRLTPDTTEEGAVMRHSLLAFALVLACAAPALAQDDDNAVGSSATMRPVIRGRQAAVSSMKAEATDAARRMLQAGGNAFDAAVAGQAALAVTDFPSNGVGSDTVILLYDVK